VWHDKMANVGYVGDLANTWEHELLLVQGVGWKAASFREWLEHRRRPGSSGPEAAQADKALESRRAMERVMHRHGAMSSIDSSNTAGR